MKTAVVCGAGGFIGSHLVKRLKSEGYWVRGVDLKLPEYSQTVADDFQIADLRHSTNAYKALAIGRDTIDEVYQLAADMGGAGYIFTGDNDANVMQNSAAINLNMAEAASDVGVGRLFYSSSACIYPKHNQVDPTNPKCSEESAYPAYPDSEYGWEKLFSERLYMSYYRNFGLSVRIARFHNIFGPEGTWKGGKEKAPAAVCRKVIYATGNGDPNQSDEDFLANVCPGINVVEIWGKGDQTRSFLYIDECVEGIRRLMNSDVLDVLNIGSEEMISINDLARMAIEISGKRGVIIKNVPGPEGVRGRNSDNALIREKLGWAPSFPLRSGMEITYKWILEQALGQRCCH